jgi:hypothetical protein
MNRLCWINPLNHALSDSGQLAICRLTSSVQIFTSQSAPAPFSSAFFYLKLPIGLAPRRPLRQPLATRMIKLPSRDSDTHCHFRLAGLCVSKFR